MVKKEGQVTNEPLVALPALSLPLNSQRLNSSPLNLEAAQVNLVGNRKPDKRAALLPLTWLPLAWLLCKEEAL